MSSRMTSKALSSNSSRCVRLRDRLVLDAFLQMLFDGILSRFQPKDGFLMAHGFVPILHRSQFIGSEFLTIGAFGADTLAVAS